jgi:P27 family predicted phage terminase small subunit
MPTPKKAVADHRLQGTYRADRHAEQEVRPVKAPTPPDDLPEPARAKWVELAALLAEAGVLTGLDVDLLGVYCRTFSIWAAAQKEVEEQGPSYRAGGLIRRHPSLATALQCARDLAALADKLALSPSGRQRLRVKTPDVPSDRPLDPLEELLKRAARGKPARVASRKRD